MNTAKLPAFIVEGKTRLVGVRSDPPLTRLIDTRRDRHTYLVKGRGTTRADRATRLALALLQRWAVVNALDDFTLQIARQLKENPRVGYLVKINKYASLEDTEGFAANLLTPVGFGLEPLDALAESYRIPAYRAIPSAMPDASEYVWYTWDADQLVVAQYDLDFPRKLEIDARAEANRRFVRGNVKVDTATGIARAQAAEYWRELAQRRLSDVNDFEQKRRIADLNARLQAAQDQFNFAYQNYQTTAKELARNAAEMQTLERIGAVIGLLQAGAQAVEAAQQWRANRAAELTAAKDTHRKEAVARRSDIVSSQTSLANEWSTVPTVVWASAVIPQVDLKFEVLEHREYPDSDTGTTRVILYKE